MDRAHDVNISFWPASGSSSGSASDASRLSSWPTAHHPITDAMVDSRPGCHQQRDCVRCRWTCARGELRVCRGYGWLFGGGGG